MATYKEILKNEEINAMIEQGNNVLKCLGYTEHSKKHAAKVAEHAAEILKMTGSDEHEIELAKIAGYMHDIGNCINRQDHAHSGAIHFKAAEYAAERLFDDHDCNRSS